MIASIAWALSGTFLLAFVGIKLPGLEFKNQRVEAAYRKELVYGEDDVNRAKPHTVKELFSAVRRNYFRLYFHYMYFNIARILYLQVDVVFGLVVLFPDHRRRGDYFWSDAPNHKSYLNRCAVHSSI